MTSFPIMAMFAIYLGSMLLIGWLGYRATSTFSDYVLGGRKLGSFVVALAAGASDMSGWLLMGLPGAIFLTGLSESWIAIGLLAGAYMNWRFVAARLRVYTEKSGNALTLPDFFSNRFEDGSQLLRVVSAVVILVFFTIYAASGVVAGARLFESMFAMDYIPALWLGAFCVIGYVFVGGFLAVSWTDTIQATLMFVALVLTPVMVILSLGGITPSIEAVLAVRPEGLNMLQGKGFIVIVSLLAWGLGYMGQPHILVRFMAAESAANLGRARRIGMSWMLCCMAGAVAVGFFGIAYFAAHPGEAVGVNANAERVFIEAAMALFNPWMVGVVLASILAAVMSTLSAQLLVCSSSLTQDIYTAFFRKNASQRERVWFSRAMVLMVAGIAIMLASDPDSRVLGMVSYAWAGFGAAFGPVVLLALFWSRMTRNGALAGMLVGAGTVLVWKQFAWFGLYEIIPGFVLAMLAIVAVSLLGKRPALSVRAVFGDVDLTMKNLHVRADAAPRTPAANTP
jgi:sodium/proline symporter